MQRLWNDLRPKGSFNLILAEVGYKSADKKLNVTTRVEPVGDTVSIEPTFFRYRLEKVQGAINFRDGRADFENVRGIHERTTMGTSGYCEYTPDGNWHLRFENLAVDRLRLDRDRDLIAALPPKLRKTVERLNPVGLVNLSGAVDWWGNSPPPADATTECNLEECKLRTAWNVEFDLQQAGLRAGLDLKNVNGGVRLNGECDGQQVRSHGELNVDSVTWNGFQFSNVKGPFWIDEHQVILGSAAEGQTAGNAPRHLTTQAYGGTVTADAAVSLDETPRYTAQVAIADGNLVRFCTEAIPGRQTLKGRIEGGRRSERHRRRTAHPARPRRNQTARCRHLSFAGDGGPVESFELETARHQRVHHQRHQVPARWRAHPIEQHRIQRRRHQLARQRRDEFEHGNSVDVALAGRPQRFGTASVQTDDGRRQRTADANPHLGHTGGSQSEARSVPEDNRGAAIDSGKECNPGNGR